jgi:hypothetical protein
MLCGSRSPNDEDTEVVEDAKEINTQNLPQHESRKQNAKLSMGEVMTVKGNDQGKKLEQTSHTLGTDGDFVMLDKQPAEKKTCEPKAELMGKLKIQKNVLNEQALSQNINKQASYSEVSSQQVIQKVILDDRTHAMNIREPQNQIDSELPFNRNLDLNVQVYEKKVEDPEALKKLKDVDEQVLDKKVDKIEVERPQQKVIEPKAFVKPTLETKMDQPLPILKPKLLNLGAMNQAEYGINRGRPPACTLYSGLFILFAFKNKKEMKTQFLKDNAAYFSKMQREIMDEGISLFMYAKERGLTSVLDGRINPDELQSALPNKFGKLYMTQKSWCSGNPLFGEEQQIQLITLTGNVFRENIATFIVADAETFALVAVGDEKHAWYFNSHKTGLAREGGRATHFGVMNDSSLLSFLTNGMHGNQPCNSIDLFFFNIF